MGNNGAGKTTLLRVLAGIYEPVAGEVTIAGSVTALLDPNLGMNQDLTGRENVLLRGLYGGLSPPAIRRLQEEVRDFAELGDFLDLPVRLYSSGMMVRLGFALATAIRPQVLLMDEWFLAGDAAFMEKARERLESMVRGAGDSGALIAHGAGAAGLVHAGDLARAGAEPDGRAGRAGARAVSRPPTAAAGGGRGAHRGDRRRAGVGLLSRPRPGSRPSE